MHDQVNKEKHSFLRQKIELCFVAHSTTTRIWGKFRIILVSLTNRNQSLRERILNSPHNLVQYQHKKAKKSPKPILSSRIC